MKNDRLIFFPNKKEAFERGTYNSVSKHWKKKIVPKDYEMSIEAIKLLREIKNTFSLRSRGTLCYCSQLIDNNWNDIQENSVLRPCAKCRKIIDIVLDYAEGKRDFRYVTKRVLRYSSKDNFEKMKLLNLIQKFKKEWDKWLDTFKD